MATFDRRLDKDGKYVYRARVRRKGYAPQVATFHKLSDARKWAQVTEATMLEGRHFKTTEAKSHTLADLIIATYMKSCLRKAIPRFICKPNSLPGGKNSLGIVSWLI
jgi:hypothetical protein